MKRDHVFTLGIEEEFQIIDPETRELRSHIQEILAGGKMLLKEHVKPEMHQSVVELGTEICSDAQMRAPASCRSSQRAGRTRCAARFEDRFRRHPSIFTLDGPVDHVDERYATIVKDMQQIARACLIFGLHVHVGIPDREEGIDVMNQARYFLPHICTRSRSTRLSGWAKTPG